MEMSRDYDRQRKESAYMTMTKKDACIKNEKQLQNHFLTFIHQSNFQLPAFYLAHL